MDNDKKAVKVKKQVTSDLILQLYNEMLEMEDETARKERKAVIDVLSEHMGDWLVLDVDKDD